uniref:Uncharacterized protein n=1 Tax=Panagrolaimus superbus TaxID=310955 RepID=A0A914YL25_9BILA
MIKNCKYFFIKTPILVISDLIYDRNGWETEVNKTLKSIDINTISSKLWITYQLCICQRNFTNNSLASSIIPKIYQCDATYLSLSDQVITLNEFIILCSSVIDLTSHQVTVKNDDGTVVLFEKLTKQLPKLKSINYTFTTPSNNTSKKSFEELWKIRHFSIYDYVRLFSIPEDFNIDCFYSFMKVCI